MANVLSPPQLHSVAEPRTSRCLPCLRPRFSQGRRIIEAVDHLMCDTGLPRGPASGGRGVLSCKEEMYMYVLMFDVLQAELVKKVGGIHPAGPARSSFRAD